MLDRREVTLENGDRLVRVLIDTSEVESLLEWLHDEIGEIEGYRIIISPVTATVPRPSDDEDEDDDKEEKAGQASKSESSNNQVSRISREEVYQEVNDSISVTNVHYMLVALSTIVAIGGMMRDSPAVVIGAMVIAPLIGPNIALALGTTLADGDLLKRSMKVNFIGLLIAFGLAVVAGLVLPVDAMVNEIASRTEINIGDAALALAAGIAGVLSVTRGVSTALIGVMVAVALLPPLVAMGMLVGLGLWSGAYGAGILTLTNIVAINLAGVVTFLVQGISPMKWYDKEKAKGARRFAITLWLLLLALLVGVILFAPPTPV